MKTFHVPRTRSVRVLWMLEEMGLAYEAVKIGFPPTDPEFLAANTTGTLALAAWTAKLSLTESVAILQYLAARHGPTSLAVAPDEAGFPDYLQFLEVGEATLAAPLTSLVRTRFMAPDDQKANWTAENTRTVFADRVRLVASQLEHHAYMAADRFTAADISVGYALGFGEGLGMAGGYVRPLLDYWRPASGAARLSAGQVDLGNQDAGANGVQRASSASCALRASFRAKRWPMSIFTAPVAITWNNASELSASSSGLAT